MIAMIAKRNVLSGAAILMMKECQLLLVEVMGNQAALGTEGNQLLDKMDVKIKEIAILLEEIPALSQNGNEKIELLKKARDVLLAISVAQKDMFKKAGRPEEISQRWWEVYEILLEDFLESF